jgi:hypothetical protein
MAVMDREHQIILDLLIEHGAQLTNMDLVELAADRGVRLTWDQVRSVRYDLFFVQLQVQEGRS